MLYQILTGNVKALGLTVTTGGRIVVKPAIIPQMVQNTLLTLDTQTAVIGSDGSFTLQLAQTARVKLTVIDGAGRMCGDLSLHITDDADAHISRYLNSSPPEVLRNLYISAEISAETAVAAAGLTSADKVQTGLDRVATAEYRVQTGLDNAATAADRVQTGLDKAATAADMVQTGLDRVATAADKVQTGLDVIATAADKVQTGLDKAATAADKVQTGLDKVATAADRVQTGLDKAATAADKVQTGLDRVATAADKVQTGLDNAATAADRVQTGLDKAATAADMVQTGLDRVATAADKVQTGLDVIATAADKLAIDGIAEAVAIVSRAETIVNLGNVSGTQVLNMSLGTIFVATATGPCAWSITNPISNITGITLVISNGGLTGQIFPGTAWPGGYVPSLTVAGVDIVEFLSLDGWVSQAGFVSGRDIK